MKSSSSSSILAEIPVTWTSKLTFKDPMAPKDSSSPSKKAEDRISQLPEEILHQILSYLPTNYSIRTCILSTRWKNTWMGVSDLTLDDKHYYADGVVRHQEKFLKFVEMVFLRVNANVTRKFYLSTRIYLQPAWVDLLVGWLNLPHRKVEEISLEFNAVCTSVLLPLDFLSCKSLKVKCGSSFFLNLPDSLCLSRLMVLHLVEVNLTCNQENQIVCLSCPVLEDLDLNCRWGKINDVTFLAPALKRLALRMFESSIDYGNEEFEIKVSTECLIFLHTCIANSYCKLSLPKQSSLREALIDIGPSDWFWTEFAIESFTIVLGAISNVHHLTLTDYTLESSHLFMKQVALSSLKSLTITITCHGESIDGRNLTELFHYLPNIEFLICMEGLAISDGDDEDGIIGETCGWKVESTLRTMPNLKSVAVYNVYGNKKELGLVKFLLKNASALEKITITSSSSLSADPEKHLEITKQLQILSKLSATCLIDFS